MGQDFEPLRTSASMSYDIKALKSKDRNKKLLGLIAGLVVIGAIAAVVLVVGIDRPAHEIKDPNAIDPSLLKVDPPKPLARVGVVLATKPEGAHVIINGILAQGTTPGDFELVDGKRNEVIFYHPEHDPFTAIMDGAQDGAPEEPIELPERSKIEEARQSTLLVESQPLGGVVFHNGEQVGTTPHTLRNLNPDVEHHVLIKVKDYHPYAALLRPYEGQQAKLSGLLDPLTQRSRDFTVDLSLETSPPGASASVNGKPAGITPSLKPMDRHQLVEVSFEAANYKPLTRFIETREVGTLMIRPALKSIKRELGTVSIALPRKTASVYIGSNQYEPRDLKKLELPEGPITIVVELEDGKRVETQFEVLPARLTRYRAEVLNNSLRMRESK